jgi:signal transduction histidine kinase
VAIDPTYFKQALLNLLNNALEAILGQADQSARKDRIVVGSRRVERAVEVLVIDSGPGIPEDQRARIFEPYYSTKKSGSGLGLPTARRILEEHGGTLTVDSEVGRGTSFRILLPVVSSDRAAEQ